MNSDKIFITVNGRRISLAAFAKMPQAKILTVDASGCTALTELKADAAEYVDASGCTALTELKADAAKTVYASGCTALTELKADAAEYVYARGCKALTELKADAAEYVYARGCTALTELKADAAKTVYASGCTALTELPFVDAGTNERGYEMFAVVLRGEWRIIAGCRNFNLQQARAHWGTSKRRHPEILARLETMAEAMAQYPFPIA